MSSPTAGGTVAAAASPGPASRGGVVRAWHEAEIDSGRLCLLTYRCSCAWQGRTRTSGLDRCAPPKDDSISGVTDRFLRVAETRRRRRQDSRDAVYRCVPVWNPADAEQYHVDIFLQRRDSHFLDLAQRPRPLVVDLLERGLHVGFGLFQFGGDVRQLALGCASHRLAGVGVAAHPAGARQRVVRTALE